MKNMKLKQNFLPEITIGIPAYNEGSNIASLINSIFKQKAENFKLINIIVVSDGSTDNTNQEVKKIINPKIILIESMKRRGLAVSLNKIVKLSKSEILVTLDADIELGSIDFIEKLISPIAMGLADYTTSTIFEKSPRSYFEQCLSLSMQLKRCIYSHINNGNNIYTSYGLARAFSSQLYKKIKFPVSVGNDMYSYLFTVTNNFKFLHVAQATALYRLPKNIEDSSLQSIRFIHAKKLMTEYFDQKIVRESFKIPLEIYVKSILDCSYLIITNPLKVFIYFTYLTYNNLLSKFIKTKELWTVANTSKHA